ncbi:MAG: hypothetical protein ACLP5H_10825 [Desulfomonilaceae bacterium]
MTERKKAGRRKGIKNRLKPISFYGHNPEDVIRAFMKVDPKKVKQREEEERRRDALTAEQVKE